VEKGTDGADKGALGWVPGRDGTELGEGAGPELEGLGA
jgi:hypothetical protein